MYIVAHNINIHNKTQEHTIPKKRRKRKIRAKKKGQFLDTVNGKQRYCKLTSDSHQDIYLIKLFVNLDTSSLSS